MNKEIIIQQEIKLLATDYELVKVSYSNKDRICNVKINLITENGTKYDYPKFSIWEGEEYDQAGQWSDEDVDKRILELLNS